MQSSRAFLAAASAAMWVILADAHAQSPYPPRQSADCRNTGSFEAWLAGIPQGGPRARHLAGDRRQRRWTE